MQKVHSESDIDSIIKVHETKDISLAKEMRLNSKADFLIVP